jgi:hypothetical protein
VRAAHTDVGADLGERLRDRAADPAARAGDDRDLVRQLEAIQQHERGS